MDRKKIGAMSLLLCACAMLVLPATAARVQDRTHLAPDVAIAMPGKSLALTLHDAGTYQRVDRGTAWAGIIGGALVNPGLNGVAGNADGKKYIAGAGLTDPSVTTRDLLANLLRDTYALQLRAPDTTPTEETRPKKLSALHPEADYVLDVRTLLWKHSQGIKNRGDVRLWQEIQLIDVATRHTAAWMRCDIWSVPPPGQTPDVLPTFDQLEADGGKALDHAYAVLAARCARKFASERLRIAPEKLGTLNALADARP